MFWERKFPRYKKNGGEENFLPIVRKQRKVSNGWGEMSGYYLTYELRKYFITT